jgi:hypothetical protein
LRSIVVLALASGVAASAAAAEPRRFATSDGLVELQFPPDWVRNAEQNPFDLQCWSKDGRIMTALFTWKREDLARTTKPRQLLERQIDDMRSKRKDFVLVERETTYRDRERALTSVVYAGEKGGTRNNYRFTLAEFPASPDVYVLVLQTSFPSEWSRTKPILEAITRSARARAAK